ncbi:putative SAM-dependent methyltransferase [Salsuginibacillus halophilus]|uniref:Putative SAM-dependent methyltransferase n=1 Tax=Salsuginibacillus halophilus TaxID=517424 RepID=A0A2P8HYF9_9BACI|nr:class I SAM-dependent methyltransferase [Salsuginibacillus halophilus]PSL51272.1 putative SAM-dependent methyltransferase [Salsuginibacillus halophilus]
MIVTTTRKAKHALGPEAEQTARQRGWCYVPRDKQSVPDLLTSDEEVLVLSNARDMLYHPHAPDDPFFFHPSMAWLRRHELKHDPLTLAAQAEEGMSVLDATLGLGADSILFSMLTGRSGQVTSLEINAGVAEVVARGLQKEVTKDQEFNEAMRRICVKAKSYETYIMSLPENAFDIIYFDPMFEQSYETSASIQPLKVYAEFSPLNETVLRHACRAAQHRVVLKDRADSPRFQQLGITNVLHTNRAVRYGWIDVRGSRL